MSANPYVEARREWDERYADLVVGKRNWQLGNLCTGRGAERLAESGDNKQVQRMAVE